jgi:hypothetical protein
MGENEIKTTIQLYAEGIKRDYPDMDDEEVFHHAKRLFNAKMKMKEWELLNPILLVEWYEKCIFCGRDLDEPGESKSYAILDGKIRVNVVEWRYCCYCEQDARRVANVRTPSCSKCCLLKDDRCQDFSGSCPDDTIEPIISKWLEARLRLGKPIRKSKL